MADTFEVHQYGRPDGRYPVINIGDAIDQWPTIVITLGHLTAVVQCCGVGADGDHPHLSLDVHSFVDGLVARAGVFRMEKGKRYHAFDDPAPGTSHGWPAVRAVTVLIGQPASRDDQRS